MGMDKNIKGLFVAAAVGAAVIGLFVWAMNSARSTPLEGPEVSGRIPDEALPEKAAAKKAGYWEHVGQVPNLRPGGLIRVGGSPYYGVQNYMIRWGCVTDEHWNDYKRFVFTKALKWARAKDLHDVVGPCDVEVTSQGGTVFQCTGTTLELWGSGRSLTLRFSMFQDDHYGHRLNGEFGIVFNEEIPLKHIRVVVGGKYLFEWRKGEPWFWPVWREGR